MPEALLVTKESLENDIALKPDKRGARKVIVTGLFEKTERLATHVVWGPPDSPGQKCPVQVMQDTEVAVFNHHAAQDLHFHRAGTEMYMVLEGTMGIEVEGKSYTLGPGDMIVVNRNAVHQVKTDGAEFMCRVVTVGCGGASDKFTVE